MDNSNLLNSLVKEAQSIAGQGKWDSNYLEINTKILLIDTLNEGATTRLGRYYYEHNQFDKAKSYFEKALKINPKNSVAKSKLFEMEYQRKKEEELRTLAQKIEQEASIISDIIEPQDAYILGREAQKDRRDLFALKCFKRAYELSPNKAYGTTLGAAYRKCKLFDKAIETYQKVIKSDPQNAASYIGIAAVLRDKGILEEALETYDLVLNYLSPNNSYALNGKGAVLMDLYKKGGGIESGLLLKAEHCFELALLNGDILSNEGNVSYLQVLLQCYKDSDDKEGMRRVEHIIEAYRKI